jgi:hypothetical protein
MKKSIFPFLMALMPCLILTSVSNAQVSIGAKGGLNVSNLNGLTVDNFETNASVGFHLGGFATFNLGRNFAIQPELVYSTQGAKLENATTEENLKLNYFNIPIMLKVLTNGGFYVEAGPQIGFNVGDVDWDNVEGSVKGSDFSVCGGIGFQGMKSPFGIGARYNIGVSELGEVEGTNPADVDYKNGVFQLSLYWRLLGGGKLKK